MSRRYVTFIYLLTTEYLLSKAKKSVTNAEKFKLDEQVLFISLINLIV